MKRIVTILSVLAVLAIAPASMAAEYGYTFSYSSTDPAVTTSAPGTPFTTISVYMWLTCTTVDGVAAIEFGVNSGYAAGAGSFVPLSGAINLGSSTDPRISIGGCPTEPLLVGRWDIFEVGAGGNLCTRANADTGFDISVDCDTQNPQAYSNAWTGAASDGTTPCQIDDCAATPVEASSWGAIKGLYR